MCKASDGLCGAFKSRFSSDLSDLTEAYPPLTEEDTEAPRDYVTLSQSHPGGGVGTV